MQTSPAEDAAPHGRPAHATEAAAGPGGPPAQDAAAFLEVCNVAFRYANGTEALRDVSFAIRPGRNVAVIGPSGCGKSTLLHLVAELSRPTAGAIRWNRGDDGAAHPLSMVFQKDTLLPWLTVRKNVGATFRFRNTRGGAARARVDELLRLGGLEAAAEQYPYQLSGGMRRRTQFLAAIAPQPRLLLLDEPFSSLDEPTRIALHQDVLRICRELDMSLLLITHDLAEAISLADEILVLTRRPASVVSRHEVPFGRERDVHALREDPRFHRMYADVWHELNAQIQASAS
ncbi:MAG: ABC transporter ATP-binding protein [Microbacteriaceae bacterium]